MASPKSSDVPRPLQPVVQQPMQQPPSMTGSHSAVVSHGNDGKTTITLTVDRGDVRDVLDRWTFSQCEILMRSGDREVVFRFPKMHEAPRN